MNGFIVSTSASSPRYLSKFLLIFTLGVFFLAVELFATDSMSEENTDKTTLASRWKKAEDLPAGKRTVLVVSPPVFEQALQPWIEYRQSQGYEIFFLPLAVKSPDGGVNYDVQTRPVASPGEIRAKIIKAAKGKDVAAIVLVGDGAPTNNAKYGWRDVVPAARVPSSTIQAFGSEDFLATDSFYADFDSDGLADAPIGRFPVETPEELNSLIDKTIRYETSSPVGNWMRRINVFAGPNGLDLRVIGSKPGETISGPNPLGGFSSLVDSVVSGMARKMFAEYLPQEFFVSLTQCSLQSVFCPYPPDFGDVFLERANEGALFFIYMGHGRVYGLDRFEAKNRDYGIFEIDDCAFLRSNATSPIALFFACYTGAYDANDVSLAEKTALSPNGPVAVFAASRLTAPYGMCVLGSALMERAFSRDSSKIIEEPAILGRLILDSQKIALESPDYSENTTKDESFLNSESVFKDDLSNESSPGSNGGEDSYDSIDRDDSTANQDSIKPGSQLEKLNKRLEKGLVEAEEIKRINTFRLTLDRAAAILDPTANRLREQIKDHVQEFNLFGDPLLRVKFPKRVNIEAPDVAYSTNEVEVSGNIPSFDDKEFIVQVELLLADFRTSVQKTKRGRPFSESEESRREFQETYRKANNFVVDAVRTSTRNGRFEATIVVPDEYSGESIVRIAAFNGSDYYIGSKRVLIRPLKKTEKIEKQRLHSGLSAENGGEHKAE